jgi:hypothetical protein
MLVLMMLMMAMLTKKMNLSSKSEKWCGDSDDAKTDEDSEDDELETDGNQRLKVNWFEPAQTT